MRTKTENADLSGSEFTNVNLSGTQFRDVNLGSSSFADVNLSGAKFDDINLTGVVIRKANCSHLSMEDACYEGMRIDGILVSELLAMYRGQNPETK
jgi:uncharacterized protein YjbI with pentapeptide repeats